jgi:histidinol-phosphate aminotransferase
MYGVLANLNAVENREVLLTEDFQPEIEKIMEAVDTKMIFYVQITQLEIVFR